MEQINPSVPTSFGPTSKTSTDIAILFLDMVSYSRRIAENEIETLEFMSRCFDAVRILARRHHGVLIKTMGDGALLSFSETECAVEFGLELHRLVEEFQIEAADPFLFRVGLHVGDVKSRNGDVFGQTVNIASRLQGIAEPGECIVSQDVYSSLNEVSELEFESIGIPNLKNISARIRAYRVIDPLAKKRAQQESRFAAITLMGTNSTQSGNGSRPLGPTARGILAYLALSAGGYETCDRIEALFGGAEAVESACAELDKADTGFEVKFHPDSKLMHLNAELSDTDLGKTLGNLRKNKLSQQLFLEADWPQGILAGLDGITPLFDSWLRITRERWKWLLLRELEHLIEHTDPRNEQREQAAQTMLLQEPGNESASLAKIECRLAHDDRSGALEEFERLKDFLSEHYGIAPGERIRRVIQSFKGRKPTLARNAEHDVPSRRRLKIIVHGFASNGATTLSDITTFRDELISNLSRFRDWSVVDGAMNNSDPTGAPEASDYDIEGHPRDQDGLLTLTLVLKKGNNGRVLWSETFEVTAENWISLHHEVLRSIAARLESYISCDRLATTIGTSGPATTTIDAWLRGDQALMQWTARGAEEARVIFRAILETEPDHAPSLFRIASISNIQHVIWPGREREQSEIEEADSFAARAVAIDPLDARVQRTVAWTAAMNGAFARASMHMDLAANLNPSSPTTLASCAMGFAWFGEQDKAKTMLTQCEALSSSLPPWGWAYHASTSFFLDRLDDALLAAELGGDSIPDTKGWLAAILARQGETEPAGRTFRAFFERVSPHWASDDEATPQAVAKWFARSYPIKEPLDREKLYAAIETARAAAY